ncbi:MAG: hypothetical protein ACFFER_20330 [Candidatus Thorarchaeota archaeon]
MVEEATEIAAGLSMYAFLLFTLLCISQRMHIRIEERELQERFGEGYSEYMKNLPGLHVRLRDSGTCIDFLGGNE